MILQALYKLYDKLSDELPPMGMAYVKFYYAIVIDKDGRFLHFEPLGDENGQSVLTSRPEERTSAPVPHLMGDNGSYVLALKTVNPGKTNLQKEMEANKKNHKAFVDEVRALHQALPDNEYAAAVSLFYDRYDEQLAKMTEDPAWTNVCKVLTKNFTFRINGRVTLGAADEELVRHRVKASMSSNKNAAGVCLITGNHARPVDTTTSTFIPGGKSNGKLVAFQIDSGYDSYGKQQGLNAPISEEAEFKYTTALLYLLRSGSQNKFRVGNRTYVFWTSAASETSRQMEACAFSLFNMKKEDEDAQEGTSLQVIKVLKAIFSGILTTSLDERFFVLGLAPNAARIAVVFWANLPLREFAGMLLKHFDDMEIAGNSFNKPYKGLYSILLAITLNRNAADVTPNLADAVAKSIFMGTPYPVTLMETCIRRIRAEYSIGITRAAILKACINRNINNPNKITIMLDKENKNQGYLCGRLFAVMDKIQSEVSNNHSTIRERYLNAASSTPATVFPTILNLSAIHSEKLEQGRRIYFERQKQEIVSKLDANGFPSHLSLEDQGRFFIGYYHQMQDFFTKKDDAEKTSDQ